MSLVAAKCTQCGANIQVDDSKEAGICPNCGTAFITEKTINNYINNTSNTYNIENAKIINNSQPSKDTLFELARRFLTIENYEESKKYYQEILLANPNSWEALFFSIYCEAKMCKVGEIGIFSVQLYKTIPQTLQLIDSVLLDETKKVDALIKVRDSAVEISNNFFNVAYNMAKKYTDFSYVDMATSAANIRHELCKSLMLLFENNSNLRQKVVLPTLKGMFGNGLKDNNKIYYDFIRKYESDFVVQEKAGCYIATCVYGSYDCPEVWTLRRYRDNMLCSSWYGRAFIKLYYTISPTLVKWFGKTKWFKKMWKKKLDKMVEKLQNNGVECSSYQDKDWN